MGRMKITVLGAFAATLMTAGVLAAQGTPADRPTFVTVSGPVSLPGVTLPAGTYLFRLADSQASRNVVQIFDRDRTKIFATLIAIPATRNEPSDEAVVTFRETPADRAPAVRYWFYAGETSGQEFAYPREQAMKIASASGESVMAIDTTSTDIEAMKSAEMSRVEPGAAAESSSPAQASAQSEAQQPAATETRQPATAEAQPQTPPQPQPTTSQSERSAATQPPATPSTSAQATQPSAESTPPAATNRSQQRAPAASAQERPQPTGTSGELPRTASELPLVGMIGLGALSAALITRAVRRRVFVKI